MPSSDVGTNIRLLREARGMSRPVLAGLCGRGPDWLKKIESGDRPLTNYHLLLRVADALGVSDLAALTGGPSQPLADMGEMRHPVAVAIWGALQERHLPAAQPVSGAPNVAVLAGRVEQGWRLWHSSRHNRTEVGALLPDLLRDVEQATRVLDGVARRRALAVLADVYMLVQQHSAYIVTREYAFLTIDRALDAARGADDPLAFARAAICYANVMRTQDYDDQALAMTRAAIKGLRPGLENRDHETRALYGFLWISQAHVWARLGREGETWAAWDQADAISKSLPPSYVEKRETFCRASMDIWAATLHLDLAKPGMSISATERLDPQLMPSPERRSRLWLDLGRAHLARGEKLAALHAAQRAFAESPEKVRHTPVARILVNDLKQLCKGPLHKEAVDFAARVALTP
jgi:transcriptional regulator with XRE-family HTH domain